MNNISSGGRTMLIQETSISLRYKKIDNLKRTYFINEHILKEQFNEATVLPIPDDAPFEVPRIIVKSKNEHSQLNITPVNATLQINYNDGFEKDWNACKQYILEKMNCVFDFLNILTKNEYEYIGIVSTILMDEYNGDTTRLLSNNLLNGNMQCDIYDLNIKYTFAEEDKYFVNIVLQNARLYRDGIEENSAGALCQANQLAEAVGVIVDINDRYGFNNNVEYKSDRGMLESLVEKLSDILETKLRLLVEQGVY